MLYYMFDISCNKCVYYLFDSVFYYMYCLMYHKLRHWFVMYCFTCVLLLVSLVLHVLLRCIASIT